MVIQFFEHIYFILFIIKNSIINRGSIFSRPISFLNDATFLLLYLFWQKKKKKAYKKVCYFSFLL